MQITREKAVALFNELGLTTAEKWNKKRMEAKLAKVDELVDDDITITDDALRAELTDVLAAIENGEEITIGTSEAATEEAPKAAPAKASKAKVVPKEVAPEAMPDSPAAKEPKAPKAPKTPEAPKAPGLPGVREMRTRPFLAGVVLKKHGLKKGITDEMTNELDDLYGKVNPRESFALLTCAWHIARGFQNGDSK